MYVLVYFKWVASQMLFSFMQGNMKKSKKKEE